MYTVFIVRFFLQRKYVGSFVSEFFFYLLLEIWGAATKRWRERSYYDMDVIKISTFLMRTEICLRVFIFFVYVLRFRFSGYSVLFFHSRVECTIQKRHYDAHLRFSIPHFHDDIHIRTAHISLHPSVWDFLALVWLCVLEYGLSTPFSIPVWATKKH